MTGSLWLTTGGGDQTLVAGKSNSVLMSVLFEVRVTT